MNSPDKNSIQAMTQRAHANDNNEVSEDERKEMRESVEAHFGEILTTLGIDWQEDPNSQDTPKRVAKMFVDEIFTGRFTPPPKITVFPNTEQLNQLVIVGPLSVKSVCSHHFMPIVGQAWIGYLPDESLIGLSKFPRIVDWFSRRPQIQESLTEQISHFLQEMLQPKGVAVYIAAKHFCMSHRGVNETPDATMSTISLKGQFLAAPALKAEFMAAVRS